MKIVIIGCGFAGLTSALFLSKNQENEITIIDRFEKVQAIGAGIMIQPSSLKVLDKLGIAKNLIEKGEKINVLIGTNHHQKQVFATYYEDYLSVDKNEKVFGLGIHRSIVFNELYEQCLTKQNIEIQLGKTIENIESFMKDYDLVIVANGSHSTLRNQLSIKQSYKMYPYGCIWTTIEDEGNKNTLRQYVYQAKEMLGFLPSGKIDNNRIVSIFWSLPITEKENYNKEKILQRIEEHCKNKEVIEKLNKKDFAFATYADVWMKQYHHKNVVVIGDAAHGMSPQLGQGANMAILDAYFLSECLKDIKTKDLNSQNNIEKALENYTQIRKPHHNFYTQASKFLTPLYQSSNKWYGVFRDILFTNTQQWKITRKISSHVLCGRKTSWFTNKEIKY